MPAAIYLGQAIGPVLPKAMAQAQTYPGKLVRIVVPVTAGGNVDLIARFTRLVRPISRRRPTTAMKSPRDG